MGLEVLGTKKTCALPDCTADSCSDSHQSLLSQRLHVALLWYTHRPQSDDMVTPLRPMYVLYSYMEEPLGLAHGGDEKEVFQISGLDPKSMQHSVLWALLGSFG